MPGLARFGFALGFVSLVAGCGDGKGTIAGKVTVGGKPVPFAQITFESQVGAKDVLSVRVVNGEYTTAPGRLPSGPAKASVVHSAGPPAGGGDGPKGKVETPIPSRYQSAATSGLALTVKPGENTFDAKLDP